MLPRERLRRALRREQPDRVPLYFEFTPAYERLFEEKTGAAAAEYQSYFRFDMICVEPQRFFLPTSDHDGYFQGEDRSRLAVNEWGIGYQKGSLHHFESMVHPLRNARSVEDVLAYPYPATADDESPDFKRYRQCIAAEHTAGRAVMSRGQAVGGTVFWPAYKLRGMEQLFIDMFENPELLEALLEKVTELLTDTCVKKARAGVDVLLLADDFGTQLDLMMSLELWDLWFKPRLARLIAAVKTERPDVIVAFHSDGAVEKLIPRFIELGIDALNPVQPECMDPAAIKRAYGDRLALWGTIGTQTTMPFGKPHDVERCVRDMIRSCGEGGGLLIGPTHVLEPEVPWENLIAFIEATVKYGNC